MFDMLAAGKCRVSMLVENTNCHGVDFRVLHLLACVRIYPSIVFLK